MTTNVLDCWFDVRDKDQGLNNQIQARMFAVGASIDSILVSFTLPSGSLVSSVSFTGFPPEHLSTSSVETFTTDCVICCLIELPWKHGDHKTLKACFNYSDLSVHLILSMEYWNYKCFDKPLEENEELVLWYFLERKKTIHTA